LHPEVVEPAAEHMRKPELAAGQCMREREELRMRMK
jgi:hypothetical protein